MRIGRLAALSSYVALSMSCSGRAEEAKERPASGTRAVNEASDGKAAPRPQESAVLDKRTMLRLLAESGGRSASWKIRITNFVAIRKPGAPSAGLEDREARRELEAPVRLEALMKLKNAGTFTYYQIRDRPGDRGRRHHWPSAQEIRAERTPWILHFSLQGDSWRYRKPGPASGAGLPTPVE